MSSSDSIPATALPTLTHLSSILHLLHHRNKNQHRRSAWFRHASIFRKHLAHLTDDLTLLHSGPSSGTHVAALAKRDLDARLRSSIVQRRELWRDVLVAKWQRAFSQLVADGRFAVIGIVLMAALAEGCAVVGLTAELEEMGQVEVEGVLEQFGREMWGKERKGAEEDVGEVVQREERQGEGDGSEKRKPQSERNGESTIRPTDVEMATSVGKSSAIEKRKREDPGKVVKKKQKKKKGDAIDDIFG